MDLAKLKALKVVDLKQILNDANVPLPGKITKSELINKIQTNPPALDIANAKFRKPTESANAPPDDLLAPPEEVDWNVEPSFVTAVASPPPPAAPKDTPSVLNTKPTAEAVAPVATAPVKPDAVATTTVDQELEKRRERAKRFGIPFVEQTQQKPRTGITAEQLTARRERFGLTGPKPNEKKRSAKTAEIDPDEVERRKKRAERFGLPVNSKLM